MLRLPKRLMKMQASKSILVGFCNPLLDILAVVDKSLLKKYGLKGDDAILADERHETLNNELVKNYKVEYLAGGSGQNTLRVFQWAIKKPNIMSTFFGCVGTDNFSKILEKKARESGVDPRYQHTDKEKTGTCSVLITEHSRSLVADLAAANYFGLDYIRKLDNWIIIQNADYFYITGFFFTVSTPTIMAIAHHTVNYNKVLVLNMSAPFIAQQCSNSFMEAMPYIDILIGNEKEAAAFAKELGWETNDLKLIGIKLANLPKINTKRKRVVIITQAYNPILVIQKNKTKEYPVKRLNKTEIVDTNGAGDAFVGGFLAQFVQHEKLDISVRCGMWASTEIIKHISCNFDEKLTFTDTVN